MLRLLCELSMPGGVHSHRVSEGGDLADSESALLLLVPAAEPVVGSHRAQLDLSARNGEPAHFTVLYPFLPPERLDGGVFAVAKAPRNAYVGHRGRPIRERVARRPAVGADGASVSPLGSDEASDAPRKRRPEIRKVVGGPGFEPGASRSRTVRAAELRQPPTRASEFYPAADPGVERLVGATVISVGISITVAVASAITVPSPNRRIAPLA